MSKFEELKAAYAAATPGEWNARQLGKTGYWQLVTGGQALPLERAQQTSTDPDREFIALAHNAMPALLEAVELLKMAVHALETPGDFTPEEMQEQVIGDIGVFLAQMEGA